MGLFVYHSDDCLVEELLVNFEVGKVRVKLFLALHLMVPKLDQYMIKRSAFALLIVTAAIRSRVECVTKRLDVD